MEPPKPRPDGQAEAIRVGQGGAPRSRTTMIPPTIPIRSLPTIPSARFWTSVHIMDHPTKAAVALLLICTLSIHFQIVDGNNDVTDPPMAGREVENNDRPQQQKVEPHTILIDTPPSTIIDTVKSLFSLPNTRLALIQAAASNYWTKLKTLLVFKLGQDHFTPATSLEADNDQVEAGEDGAGEKVKEAIAKSLDKSKVTIEDSARSAAKFTGDAVEKTAKKVKKTLSDVSTGRSEAEL